LEWKIVFLSPRGAKCHLNFSFWPLHFQFLFFLKNTLVNSQKENMRKIKKELSQIRGKSHQECIILIRMENNRKNLEKIEKIINY